METDRQRGQWVEVVDLQLVHLQVGRRREAHAWHGRTFKDTLARAMLEAYGITVRPPNCRHGVYADALERRRLHTGEQLELTT